MGKLLVSLLVVVGFAASADEKTCNVKGMKCGGCVGMIKAELCKGDVFETCNVEVGTIHVVTRDGKVKVTEKLINEAIANTNYKVDKCVPGAPKAQDGKAS